MPPDAGQKVWPANFWPRLTPETSLLAAQVRSSGSVCPDGLTKPQRRKILRYRTGERNYTTFRRHTFVIALSETAFFLHGLGLYPEYTP